MAQSQISRTLRGATERERVAAILSQEQFGSRQAFGRRSVVVEQGDQRRVVDRRPVGILSQDGGLHPVVEHFFRRPSARVECGQVASQDGLELLVGAEPAPQPSAASEDERERMDFPDDAGLVGEVGFEVGEVGLGLLGR